MCFFFFAAGGSFCDEIDVDARRGRYKSLSQQSAVANSKVPYCGSTVPIRIEWRSEEKL